MENGKNQHPLSFKASLEEKTKLGRQARSPFTPSPTDPTPRGLWAVCRVYIRFQSERVRQTNRADDMRGGYLRRPGYLWRKRLYVRGDIYQLGFDLN